MDVDGTLTDGKIYMGQNEEVVKAFNIKDGAGIYLELPKLGIIPIIITARKSRILENRCRELNISELHQNCKDKYATLKMIIEKYDGNLNSVAYIGDDIPDIPCMEKVREVGGVVMSPADAIPEIKELAEYVSGFTAGEGAIRDCINYLAQRSKDDVEDRVRSLINYILAGDYKNGFFPNGNSYTIQEYMTQPEGKCVLETHRKHIDVQYIIEGYEEFKTYSTKCLTSFDKYNVEKDTELWQGGIVSSHSILVPGSLIVVYNGQPHKGAIMHGMSVKVKKLICKIPV
jgi:3-deoxy-D-manno-octulosonate 8-phosphate phosphatase (KDO 8-P phosphatase)